MDRGQPGPLLTIYRREDTRERAEIERESINFMEHHLNEGMERVLVYQELDTLMSHHHVDHEKVLLRLMHIWREANPA